jgi:uncharacterized protein (DUF362 family)
MLFDTLHDSLAALGTDAQNLRTAIETAIGIYNGINLMIKRGHGVVIKPTSI